MKGLWAPKEPAKEQALLDKSGTVGNAIRRCAKIRSRSSSASREDNARGRPKASTSTSHNNLTHTPNCGDLCASTRTGG